MPDRHLLSPFYIDRLEAGLLDLAGEAWTLSVKPPRADDPLERVTEIVAPIADWTADTLAAGERPVCVAGDCMSALGMLAGLQRAELRPTVFWLDGHGDFNTPDTTPSGFLGGMPLAMAVGRGDLRILDGLGLHPVPERDVILTDGRDLDPGEAAALADSEVRLVSDFAALLEEPLPEGPIYVHFDTDIVDPAEVPAMNYPAPGGPTAELVGRVFRRWAESGRVAAVSVSCWSADKDVDGCSRQVCMGLLDVLLGR
jgi:arginase